MTGFARINRFPLPAVWVLSLLGVAGCVAPGSAPRPGAAVPAASSASAGGGATLSARSGPMARRPEYDAATQARIDDNCGPFGAPEFTRPRAGAEPALRLVARDGYVLMHDGVSKIPLWVCEHATRDECTGTTDRKDNFKPDPLLPAGQRAELADYAKSGYDRGHMAPAGNQTRDPRLKDETFFLSNMVPQNGGFNRGAWAELEERVRRKAIEAGEVYIITGPVLDKPPADAGSPFGSASRARTIGRGAVRVPTYTYKIALHRGTDGRWRCVAWMMANADVHTRPFDFDAYRVTVDLLESYTGLNFFPAIDERSAEAKRLEGTVGSLN